MSFCSFFAFCFAGGQSTRRDGQDCPTFALRVPQGRFDANCRADRPEQTASR